jgi:hypothetical protein
MATVAFAAAMVGKGVMGLERSTSANKTILGALSYFEIESSLFIFARGINQTYCSCA